MNKKIRIQTILTLAVVAMAFLGLATTSANAAIIVTPDHISTDPGVQSTLLAIDVPYVATYPATGGPDWPEDADDGFTTVNNPISEPRAGVTSNWEPDGTPLSEAIPYFTFGNGPVPSVKYVFDIPDGVTIHAIYATWFTRNADGCTYEYTEGAASGTIARQEDGAAPAADLVLSWTDSDTNTHDGDFERLFTGPITVEGGDGFELWATDNLGNAAHIDAVVIDVEIYTDPNAPDVEAGADWITWSGQGVDPNASIVEKDPTDWTNLTYFWSADVPAGVIVEFDPDTADVIDPTVTITKDPGDEVTVTLTLEVGDEGKPDSVADTMMIDVYDDPCLAKDAAGQEVTFDPSDITADCITNLKDFAILALDWLSGYTITAPVPK